MTHYVTDLDRITSALNPTGAIETFIWDQVDLTNALQSIGDIISTLESASCSSGSWSGMIYTLDILDKLSDSQWVQDIEDAVAEYEDATGETPTFDPYDSGFSFSAVVTFAVDWVAQNLASRLRSLDRVAVVVAASDNMDPQPDVIAFDTLWGAEAWVSEEVQRRVQHRVDHSPYTVTEDDRVQWAEAEAQLFIITDERV
jgi:hypothetical protein